MNSLPSDYDKLTPIMQQYWDFKKDHPDKILFFQLGDFFELFYQDAQIASKILDLTLTHRGQNQEGKIPMAGVPVHTIDNYIKKLLSHHYCVVICAQQGSASEHPKGRIVRKIQRIYTPGTSYETELTNTHEWNYLAAYCEEGQKASLCWVDLCEGIVYWKQDLKDHLLEWIEHLRPKEILYSAHSKLQHPQGQEISSWYFDEKEGWPYIQKTLPEWGKYRDVRMEFSTWRSIGALCRYVHEYVGSAHTILRTILPYYDKQEIALDPQTRKQLMIDRTESDEPSLITLFSQNIRSSMGMRLLKRWTTSPTLNITLVTQRYRDQQWWKNKTHLMEQTDRFLKQAPDFPRICSKICSKTLRPRELLHLGRCLSECLLLLDDLRESPFDLSSYENDLLLLKEEILGKMHEDPAPHLKDGMIFKLEWDEKLDEAYALAHNHNAVIEQYAKNLEHEHGCSLKIGYNHLIGHYIEISKTQTHKVPVCFHRIQTLKHTERYTTIELKKLDQDISTASLHLRQRQQVLWDQLLDSLCDFRDLIYYLGEKAAYIDLCLSVFQTQELYQYCVPSFQTERGISIYQSRHPLVERLSSKGFIPNDILLDPSQPFVLISGPNMGGKSTYMRQTALCLFMAYCGLGVPAQSCTLGPIDRIFTRMGAEDRLSLSQSTFMVELSEMAKILRESTPLSAVFIDEMGRGTSTYDGLALAQACAEYLIKHTQCFSLFSTHYQELRCLSQSHGEKMVFLCFEGKIFNNKIVFNYQIQKGHMDRSFGLYVAQEAGLPAEVLSRAWGIHSQFSTQQSDLSSESQLSDLSKHHRVSKPCSVCLEFRDWDLEQMSPKDLWKQFAQWQEKILELPD